ncbi:MAG: CPBP family intramembrane metalloprotease [Chloroflexi bacterium]|nr:CPBP family intramembrane metalloprotease [Chloroflexota bacterium]MBU1749174.1 CPBP family intramembrane metalloprotease [Chloroflexota bacterium]MBU1877788.1 CPBP family intramembrane metalloprotease [Chloroflexota bacterium]
MSSTCCPPLTTNRWPGLLVALGLLVAFVALQTGIALLVIVVVLLLNAAGVVHGSPLALVENGAVVGGASAVSGVLMIGLMWLVVSRVGTRPFRAPVALVPSRTWPLWTFPLLAVVYVLLSDGLTLVLNRPIVPEVLLPYFQGPVAVAVMMVATVVVAPLAEELLFRGVLFNALERFVPAWLTAVILALAFGVLHVMTYGTDWYVIMQTILAGLILGSLRAWTGSLWPGILFHLTNNLYATIQAIVLVNIL